MIKLKDNCMNLAREQIQSLPKPIPLLTEYFYSLSQQDKLRLELIDKDYNEIDDKENIKSFKYRIITPNKEYLLDSQSRYKHSYGIGGHQSITERLKDNKNILKSSKRFSWDSAIDDSVDFETSKDLKITLYDNDPLALEYFISIKSLIDNSRKKDY